MRFFQVIVLLFLVKVLGCDVFSGDAPSDGCPGEIQVLSESVTDMDVYLGEEALSLRIGSDTLAFNHSLGYHLTIIATSDAPSILESEVVTGGTVTVALKPIQSGTAQVDIKARDTCGLEKQVTFTTQVLDVCEEEGKADADIYFPVEPGRVWKYKYYNLRQLHSPMYVTEGTVTWEIVSTQACVNGVQPFQIQESLEGLLTLPADNPDYQSPVQVERVRSGMLKGRQLMIEEFTDEIEVPWLARASGQDTLQRTINTRWYDVTTHWEGWNLVLKKEVGLLTWSTNFSDKYGKLETRLDLIE